MPKEGDEYNSYQFSVDAIAKTPATPKILLSILKELPQPPPPSWKVKPQTPMERLYKERIRVVPNFDPTSYVQRDQIKLLSPKMTNIIHRVVVVEEEEARRKRERPPATAPNVVMVPTPDTARARIRGLVGTGHLIANTYRVGTFEATEVIPIEMVDPWYCVRNANPRENKQMNDWWELAFYYAIKSKLLFNPTPAKQALSLGEIAANTAFNSCLEGVPWTIGELFFAGWIVFSERRPLVNGLIGDVSAPDFDPNDWLQYS